VLLIGRQTMPKLEPHKAKKGKCGNLLKSKEMG